LDLQLKGKSALVTGSTSGIGLAIARQLAREGVAVTIVGRTRKKTEKSLQSLEANVSGAPLRAIVANAATVEGCAEIVRQLPTVDILVNNLGIYEAKPFAEITDEDWQSFFEANIMSGVRLSRHYFPQMLRRNQGRIIFISSESALQIPAEMIHYGLTKTAQLSLARGLAELTSGTEVTVNSVLPGPTYTEGVVGFVEGMAKEQHITPEEAEKRFFQNIRPSSLLQRFIQPEEVATMVAYLASPLSIATNGAAVRVDGGVVRAIA
jgi:NAD(P)-dependent dehydrogenase (short-subunit alcohol dehydrogenase family)